VALLDWGPATLKLADREEWIGWTPQQRAERLGLVVLNRRFLVLGKTRMPNLAAKSLALAVQALPEHWEQAHGYKPLLAETFSDIESYEGTCYKVSNWMACGQTKGFERHRIDYYRQHDRPKKLWLKTLNRNTGASSQRWTCRRPTAKRSTPTPPNATCPEESPASIVGRLL
jgi:hypothetical protein